MPLTYYHGRVRPLTADAVASTQPKPGSCAVQASAATLRSAAQRSDGAVMRSESRCCRWAVAGAKFGLLASITLCRRTIQTQTTAIIYWLATSSTSNGELDQLVDRPLSMREARGSKPRFSILFVFVSGAPPRYSTLFFYFCLSLVRRPDTPLRSDEIRKSAYCRGRLGRPKLPWY